MQDLLGLIVLKAGVEYSKGSYMSSMASKLLTQKSAGYSFVALELNGVPVNRTFKDTLY